MASGDHVRMRWWARKGALLMGGAHLSIKWCFKGFYVKGGRNPPRGVGVLASEWVRGHVKG